jgi:hypothetical protein
MSAFGEFCWKKTALSGLAGAQIDICYRGQDRTSLIALPNGSF